MKQEIMSLDEYLKSYPLNSFNFSKSTYQMCLKTMNSRLRNVSSDGTNYIISVGDHLKLLLLINGVDREEIDAMTFEEQITYCYLF